jgi:hypothetical protein
MTKSLIELKPFVPRPKDKKPKHCSTCGRPATLEAYFDVGDRVTMIEKYCDACSKNIAHKS